MPKKPHKMIAELTAEIDAFLAKTDMYPTHFGKQAVSDGNFILRLRKGRVPTLRNIDRVREFIAGKTKAVRKNARRHEP